MFVEVTGQKLVGETFLPPASWIGLTFVNFCVLSRPVDRESHDLDT